MGEQFQQHIEPAGRFMLTSEGADTSRLPPGWAAEDVHFENPLVVPFNTGPEGSAYDATNWKARLSQEHGGKTGVALSDAIRAAGHDGIVTMKGTETAEIVDLRTDQGGPRQETRDEKTARIKKTVGDFFAKADGAEAVATRDGTAVVDDAGQPLVVYHGSPVRDFEQFDLEKANKNDPDVPVVGFWFAESEKEASDSGRFPWMRPNADNAQVRPFTLDVRNPATRDKVWEVFDDIPYATNEAVTAELQRRGYDGVIASPGIRVPEALRAEVMANPVKTGEYGVAEGILFKTNNPNYQIGSNDSTSVNTSLSGRSRSAHPTWVPCQCGDYRCLKHRMHAHECPCPPIEEWETSPY
jgi:hypothetical protein